MLACWPCQNLTDFVQVSERGDARALSQAHTGLRAAPWDTWDDRGPGLYCASCAAAVEGDARALGLADDRIDFVSPHDFDAEVLAREIVDSRADATWTRLLLPAREARHAPPTAGIHPAVLAALDRTGRLPLYTHQAAAIDAALAGDHVVQATSAGSGKSIGLLAPVLHELVSNPDATAVVVFPLKALASDQLRGLARLGILSDPWIDSSSFDLVLDDSAPPIRVSRYDGSTADHERAPARREGRLIITNPDMLHVSMLQMATRTYRDRTSWERVWAGLQYVVLDELHAYQGVFGSNVANVLRRLRRVAQHFGATPHFLTASATIGNPQELATTLTGVGPFTLVDDDGSARRRRLVLVCNPPERSARRAEDQDTSDEEIGRIAPQTVAIEMIAGPALASVSGRSPVRTIAFCRSRNEVFQLAQRVRGALREAHHGDRASAVASYAATFLSGDREEEEGKLRDGTTLAVVSTNALELGIDIPDLSFAVLVRYPGQISSFRQRIGRVGRAGEGLAVLVVGDDPLQQFLARDPDALQRLLEAPAETVVVNPDAPALVRRYGLVPAQEELGGIAYEDSIYFGDVVQDWLANASGPPDTERRGLSYWKVGHDLEPYAGLRSAAGSEVFTVLVQQGQTREAIGQIDSASAPRDAFVPAIWTTASGELYRVEGFDQRLHEIYCVGPVDSPFQTRGVPVDRVEIVETHEGPHPLGPAGISYTRLAVSRQVFSYKEQYFSGQEVNRQVERMWPAVEFDTDGLAIRLDPTWHLTEPWEPSVRAVEHVLLSVAPAVVACDPNDLEASSDRTTIYVYDSFGGGIQISRPAFDRAPELIGLALDIVSTCPCAAGCPSCVMLARRPDGNQELSKQGARQLLHLLAAR